MYFLLLVSNNQIETLQEKETYEEKNTSAGFNLSWDIRAGKFSKPTFGLSAGRGTIDSRYRSAREQTGIFAGLGGFDIYVEKNTSLKGAVIASKADKEKNRLSTGAFSFSDLKNEADYSAKSIGVEYHHYGSYDKMSRQEKNKVYNTIGLSPSLSMPAKGEASSTTKSAVAQGTIDIRETPTQDISALSRDTANSLNELGRIFDKQKIEEQQELAAAFGEEAFRLAHNLPDDGSGRKIAVHAIIGGIMSQITGAGFASGAVGAGLNEALIKNLKGIDPGTAQIISTIVGAAAAKAIGGNTLAGGSASANGTKWNWLGKEQYTFVDELLSLGEEDEDRRIDIIARYAALSNFKAQHGLTGDGDDERITASLYPILRDLIPERYRDEWLSKGLNYTLNAIVCMDERTYKKANEYRTLIETGKLTIEDYLSSSKAQYILDGVMAKQKADTVFNTNSSNGISEIPGRLSDICSDDIGEIPGELSDLASEMPGRFSNLASNTAAKILGGFYALASNSSVAQEVTPLSRELYRHAYEGEGEPLHFDADSEMSSLIINGKSFQKQVTGIGSKIPIGETQFRAISIGPEAGDPYDFHMGPGKGSLNLKITRTSENSVHVEGVFQDYYNFDHWGKLTLKGLINNGAHELQKAGILTPYEWYSDINTDIDLNGE